MTRLLWVSNGRRAPTGYGNQTNLFAPRLKRAGHDIAIFAFYGQEGGPSVDEDGIVSLPKLFDPYGNDAVLNHAKYHKAEAVITLIDAFAMNPSAYSQVHWIAWNPVDCVPLLPASAQALKSAKRIWAMTQDAVAIYHKAGFDNVDYVPHGIDSKAFAPVDRQEARRKMAINWNVPVEDRFVVVMNAANKGGPSRKGFAYAFAAFKLLADEHPDALLYVHSERTGVMGEDLDVHLQALGLRDDQVVFAPQYHYLSGMLPTPYVNDMYNAADALLCSSLGEGFGIPIMEAQMAGCPVIVTNFGAMAELCLTGWKVDGVPICTNPGTWQCLPSIHNMYLQLKAAYEARNNSALREEARQKALAYDADSVFSQHMQPALAKIDQQRNSLAARRQALKDQRRALREAKKGSAA